MRAASLLVLALVTSAALATACAALNNPDPESTALERGASRHQADTPQAIKVATFNVHMEEPKKLVAAIISDRDLRDSDVLLLQEIQWPNDTSRSNAADVAAVLGMHHVYAPGYGLRGGSGSHGVAILSRYPLRDVRAIELPRYHTVVNSGRRVALAATIDLIGGPLRVWNVHLDNRINPKKRSKQLAPVFAAIERENIERVVVAGDLNTSPFCWIGSLIPVPCGIQARRLESKAQRLGFTLPTREAGSTSKYLGMRLDAIYVRGLDAASVGVGKTRLSDHFPLWARLQ